MPLRTSPDFPLLCYDCSFASGSSSQQAHHFHDLHVCHGDIQQKDVPHKVTPIDVSHGKSIILMQHERFSTAKTQQPFGELLALDALKWLWVSILACFCQSCLLLFHCIFTFGLSIPKLSRRVATCSRTSAMKDRVTCKDTRLVHIQL